MTNISINASQKRALAIAMILAVVGSVLFLQQYIMLIVFSAIVAVLFNPLYQWLLKKGRKPSQAATLTLLGSLLVVIIPIVIVSLLTLFQIQRMVDTISSSNYSFDKLTTSQAVTEINSFLSDKGIKTTITPESVSNAISTAAQNIGKVFVENVINSVSGFFAFITTAIIYLYVFLSMLVNQKKIIEVLKKVNPLGMTISELYLDRVNAMTKATVRGQLIIAICQGVVSAAVLAAVGFSDLFFFFLMLLTVLSIIPLGAGIVTIPIGIVMMLTGNIVGGAIVIANHLLVVTNIDNVLRPRLVSPEARLDPALMILAVFAGLGLFGFIGIVVGPVIMIILVTTLQVFLEVFKDTRALHVGTSPKTTNKLLKKFQSWQHHSK